MKYQLHIEPNTERSRGHASTFRAASAVALAALLSSACGELEEESADSSPEVGETSQAITGGADVSPFSIMTYATVGMGNRCTGVVVGKRDIITAAHCSPQAGDAIHFYGSATWIYATRYVAWVAWPPGVDPSTNPQDVWEGDTHNLADIAYLRLTSDIPSSAVIATIPTTYPGPTNWLVQVGQGRHNNNTSASGRLKYKYTNAISTNDADGRIWTSDGGVDPGDSGGPLYQFKTGVDGSPQLEVWGVVWGAPYSTEYGLVSALYTSLARYNELLTHLMSKGTRLGCYTDGATRAMPYFHHARLSPSACVNECERRGYKFAGVQAGGQCLCGDTVGYSRVSDRECNWTCDGGGYGCGGSWRSDIYAAGNQVGCFLDGWPRALPYFHPTRLSPDACISTCRARGEPFAGVQAGGQCFCGDTLNYGRVSDSQCSWTCDSGGTGCGGSWRNDIYMTQP